MRMGSLVIACVAVVGIGCGYRPTLGSQGLAGGTHVAYTVRCQDCDVTYTAGTSTATEHMRGLWQKGVTVEATSVSVVMLTIVPTRTGVVVDHATIEIDGAKVAEASQTSPGPFGNQVTLSAPLRGGL